MLRDILVDIAGRLNTLQDILRLPHRSVCRRWRSAANPSPFSLASQSPLLLLYSNNESPFDIVARRLYNFPAPFTRFAVAYSHGFLVTVVYDSELLCKNVVLCDLFTRNQIWLPEKTQEFDRIRPDSPDCFVFQWEYEIAPFQYLRVGDAQWTEISSPQLTPYNVRDMMFWQGELLALNKRMEVLILDLMGDSPLEVYKLGGGNIPGVTMFDRAWLGESDGLIFSVGCYEQDEFAEQDEDDEDVGREFLVFLLNQETMEWEKIKDLGERAVFVSDSGNAVMVSTSGGLGRLKKNCVYFVKTYMDGWVEFSLEDKSSQVVSHPDLDLPEPWDSHPVWVFPNCC